MTKGNILSSLLLCAWLFFPTCDGAGACQESIRLSVERAIPWLERAGAGHREQRTCFTCHNQAVPVLAVTTARARGIRIDEKSLAAQLSFTAESLSRGREAYRQGMGQGGQADTAGYALWTLQLGEWKLDETTAAVAEYLLARNRDLDHWERVSNRPPSEASSFTTTFVSLRSLKAFGTQEQGERIAARVKQVREWLTRTQPRDTEDRVFRLWGLVDAGADEPAVKTAVDALLATQRPDGGWAQTDSMNSDAYATGSALSALHLAGKLSTNDPRYQRGVQFLLEQQRADGTWYVASRSNPFQTYYESGFPYGKDQWISTAATAWAVTALALTLDR